MPLLPRGNVHSGSELVYDIMTAGGRVIGQSITSAPANG